MTDFRRRTADLLAIGGLWLLLLLAFWLIGPAGRVLAGGDLFTYFYPYWAEATRAFQAGRLPLWNPYLFMGVPFLANSQAGVLYPLNWPLWWLLPAHRSLHWSIILHLGLAATGAFVYARSSMRLGRLGAWTAGAVVALGGYLGAQVEHINQLQALSWFPWLLLLFDRAAGSKPQRAQRPQRFSCILLLTSLLPPASFAALAVVVALTLLAGHTQSAFIALVGLAVYALLPRAGKTVWRRAAVLAGAVALGTALAAAQLIPTFELTGLSTRAGGLLFNERVSFSLSPVYLARALLPGYGRPVEPENIEYVATVGVAGLVALMVALGGKRLRRRGSLLLTLGTLLRRPNMNVRAESASPLKRAAQPAEGGSPPLRFEPDALASGVLAALGLFLALGLYNPLYLLLARFVPGFAHFRVPARWLALWAFGAALLIGAGVERVARGEVRVTRRGWIVGGTVLALLLAWGAWGGRVEWQTVVGWLAAALLAAGLLVLARWPEGRRWGSLPAPPVHGGAIAALGLTALLLAELLLSARTLPHARATAPQAYTSLRPAAAHLLAAGEGQYPPARFLSLSALVFDPGDLPELRLIYSPQLSPDALYELIVAAKHREVLSPNLPLALGVPAVDGYDGGLLPLARYLSLEQAFLPAEQVTMDGRLRENLTEVPDGRWLSLFNVRYVITDKVFDAWLDDVFYDLQFRAELAAGQAAAVAHIPSFEATALGLVSYLDGASSLVDGTEVGRVTVGFADGVTRTFTLRAGQETAEGLYGPDMAHAEAVVGGHFWPGQPEGNDYVTRLRWDEAAAPVSVTVRATLPAGRLVVRGVSLIDERTGSFQSLVLSDRGRFRLVHSGDVKVYENLGALGRAFIAQRVWVVDGQAEALERMQSPDFDPTVDVVVESGSPSSRPSTALRSAQDAVRIVAYEPERVEVEAALSAPGLLVLTDADYPGWHATVDGAEVELLTADLLFRAVALDAGQHRVVFAFRPRSLSWGAGVSLTALAVMIGFLAVCGYNSKQNGPLPAGNPEGTIAQAGPL